MHKSHLYSLTLSTGEVWWSQQQQELYLFSLWVHVKNNKRAEWRGKKTWGRITYKRAICTSLIKPKSHRKKWLLQCLQKRALWFKLDNYESSYKELLAKSPIYSTNIGQIRFLWLELDKALSIFNPNFMKETSGLGETNRVNWENYQLTASSRNQVPLGTRSLKF